MERQRGLVNLTRAVLTFFLLLIVLAVGFAVGRMMVARTYAEAMPKLEKLPVAEPEVAARPPTDRPFLPSRVSVPPPAPPEEPVEEGLEGVVGEAVGEVVGEAVGELAGQGLEGALEGRGTEPGTEILPAAPGQTGTAPPQAAAEAPQPEPEAEPPRGLIAPVRPPQEEEAEGPRYSIQVGVFAMRRGAREVVEELAQAGYPAEIQVRSAEGQTLYRVLTGRYRSEYPARKALEELKKEGFTGFLVRR
jgi:cell division septation protein DedD